MRVLFMGTPEIATNALIALSSEHTVVGVYCQPDRPVGRGGRVAEPAVKRAAAELGIPVYQPHSLKERDALETFSLLAPDIAVVMAYGKILPAAWLEVPTCGCINLHASLLPAYRGAAPIQRALIAGEKETGVTVMQMDAGLDTGDILLSASIEIFPEDDAITLSEKIGMLAGTLVLPAIHGIENGFLSGQKQDNASATYAPPIKKEEGRFSFFDDARSIVALTKGLAAWPNAFFDDPPIKVRRAAFVDAEGEPGEILSLHPLIVAAKNGAVELLEVVPPGKNRMTGAAFAAGRRLKRHERLEGEQHAE